ncbi:MAG: DUF3253 domain-containing protein [Pseudomonadota bacterium]
MSNHARIRDEIMRRIHERGAGKTICPSEVARGLAASEDAWRAMMDEVRQVAGELRRDGLIDVTQKGSPVDPLTARGPIRLGLKGDDHE